MEARQDAPGATRSEGAATERLLTDLKGLLLRAEERAVEQAKAADKVIREHPYETIGLAFGLGLLIGILARRR